MEAEAPAVAGATAETDEFVSITEGQATIRFSKGNEVFYNPAQEVNRDLSVIALKMYQETFAEEQIAARKAKAAKTGGDASAAPDVPGMTILEALSATGLRSIRYWKEIPGISTIIANDISSDAVEAIRRNLVSNDVPTDKVVPNRADASVFMAQHRGQPGYPDARFDIVDLDPYGSASPFLDSAVQAVAEGGLLCVTCTDMAVLAGNHPEVCWSKYQSMPLKAKHCHEQGLRIVLGSIESHANRYKRYIVPLLSLSIDFYVRIFVRVYTSSTEVKKSVTKMSWLYQCTACPSFWTMPLARADDAFNKFTPSLQSVPKECPDCGRAIKTGGPIWGAPIHDQAWIKRMLDHIEAKPKLYNQSKKVYGLLSVAHDELPDRPLYYLMDALCNTVHTTAPSLAAIHSAFLNAGFKTSISHANPNAIKTDATNTQVWDIMRGWNKAHPSKRAGQGPAHAILSKEPSFVADFTPRKDLKLGREVPRFLPNPTEHWGPKRRAGGGGKTRPPGQTKAQQKRTASDGEKPNAKRPAHGGEAPVAGAKPQEP